MGLKADQTDMKKGLMHWNEDQEKIYRVKHGEIKRMRIEEKSKRYTGHNEKVISVPEEKRQEMQQKQ